MAGGPSHTDSGTTQPASRQQGYALDVAAGQPAAPRAAAGSGKCPMCNLPVSAAAAICLNCGFHLKEKKAIKTQVEAPTDKPLAAPPPALGGILGTMGASTQTARIVASDAERSGRFVDLYLPLGLLAAGAFFTFLNAVNSEGFGSQAMILAAFNLGVQAFVMVPLLLITVVVIAALLDVSFGSLHTAILKLAAIAIGPLSFADFLAGLLAQVTFGMGLFMIWGIYLVCCGPFVAKMFDLDYFETSITVVAIIAVRFLTMVLLLLTLYAFFFG
jgi:hypothetical protein